MSAPGKFEKGDRVAFDDAIEGPQTGRLFATLPLYCDQPTVAVVAVDHQLDGAVWKVPMIELTDPSDATDGRHG